MRADRLSLADELEQALRTHVAEVWFPRCVDLEHGGFHSAFDAQWRPGPRTGTILEFAARQTRVAARLALHYPAEPHWSVYARHGARFLRDVLWDADGGGWFWRVDTDGRPGAGATKHLHGAAYAVQVLSLVHAATGDDDARRWAEDALAWCAAHAWDREHGGFHSWLRRDGTPILSAADVPPGAPPLDPLGHAPGLKDVNVHGDWFEALLEARPVLATPAVDDLLAELARLYVDRFTNPAGEVTVALHRDWRAQPGLERFGYGFQAAHRLLSAAAVLPDGDELGRRAAAVVGHAAQRARHPAGGFVYAGPAGPPDSVEGVDVRVPVRAWWVQFEALRALAVHDVDGGAAFVEQWRFVCRHLFDTQHGGVFATVPTVGAPARGRSGIPGSARRLARRLVARRPALRRPSPPAAGTGMKASAWKDASHETDALVACAALLREGAADR